MLEGLCGLPGTSGELQRDIKQAPREAIRVLAGCQALIQVDGELVGDPLERTSFQAIGQSPQAEWYSARDIPECKAKPRNWSHFIQGPLIINNLEREQLAES